MLEFRRNGIYPATGAEGQTGRERQRLQPRRDICMEETNISQPPQTNKSHIIFVKEKPSTSQTTMKMRNRTQFKKMSKRIRPLPVIAE